MAKTIKKVPAKKSVAKKCTTKKSVGTKTTSKRICKKTISASSKPTTKKKNARAGEFWSINDVKTRGHKSLVTGKKKKGKVVEHIPVTHAPKTRGIKNIPLKENPQKGKKEQSYILPKVQKSNSKDLGKRQKTMKIKNATDKAVVRNIKKKSKLK